jgi:signal transduction histidine kinase
MENHSEKTVRASLLPVPAKITSKSIPLAGGETTIGRSPSNQIQLDHPGVSRIHAVISYSNGQFILTDLDSRNGTFVNNKRIRQSVLQNSDKISFGKRGFMFFVEVDLPVSPSTEADVTSVTGDTITITEEEPELSKLFSHSADTAVNNFFELLSSGDDDNPPTMQAHERLSYIYQLSENLRTQCEPDEILGKGLELIFEALPSAKRAAAMLRSRPSQPLEERAVKYRDPDSDEAVISVSRTVLRQVVEDRLAIVSQNVQDDVRFDDTESFDVEDIHSFVCVPLIQDDQVIGVIYIDTDDGLQPFAQSDMEFTAAMASELAQSLDQCRLQKEAVTEEKVSAVDLNTTLLAHHIKNLVTLHRNTAEKIDEQLQAVDNEDLVKNWQSFRQGFERVADLASDMLDYNQINADEVRPVDVNAVVVGEYEQFKDALVAEGIEVDLRLASDLTPWEMNETLLRRAILSLVVNAKDSLKGKKKGQVRISTEVDNSSQLIIRVKDNGCGIGKGIINDIFDLFYTTKGKYGNGVGLAMVKKFVESAGGTVSVVSHTGVGSVFTLCFPRSDDGHQTQGV